MNNVVIEGHVINIGKVQSIEGQPASSREEGSFRRESSGGSYGGGRPREGRSREGGFTDRSDRPRRRRN